MLLQRAPALVSREELLDAVWGRQAISANTVSQTILELRRALGDSAAEGGLIETRHRVGYRIVPVVSREVDVTETAPSTMRDEEASETASNRRTRIFAIALMLIALLGVTRWWLRD